MKNEFQKNHGGPTGKGRFRLVGICLLFIIVVAVFRLNADMVKIQLPLETRVFKPGPGSEIANSQCLICHSVDYELMQPPLSLKAWTAEVKKMKNTFGAPIPDDQIAPVAEYLAKNYGTETNNNNVSAARTAPAIPANMSVEALATRYGCVGCHQPDVKVVGPAFKDVRAKYLNDPDAIEKIIHQIHNGGSGKWGSVIMPPFSTIPDAEAKKLAAWIMSGSASTPGEHRANDTSVFQ